MTDKIYDVVIVGAGISGAIVAKTLSRAGKQRQPSGDDPQLRGDLLPDDADQLIVIGLRHAGSQQFGLFETGQPDGEREKEFQ